MTDKDLYGLLGVSKTSSKDEIRSAYKKLARKYHPDVNPGDSDAGDKFKEVSAAYEVLSDEERRKAYDEFGAVSLERGFDPDKAREYQQWSRQRQAAGTPFSDGNADFNLDDLLGGLSGFDGFGGQRAAAGPRRGADLQAVIELDLGQAIRGTEVRLEVPSADACTQCSGSGDQPGTASACGDCGGSGQRQVARGPMRMVTTCARCNGSGKVSQPCNGCGGSGQIERTRTLTVRIPKGADDGSTMRLTGKGAPGSQGGPAGDLLIETRIKRHALLERNGLDLTMKLPVRLDELYAGARIDVPTFDGPIKLTIPARSQPGARLRVRGKGVQRKAERGDLYVELDVRMPDKDDPALEAALQNAAGAYSRPIRQELSL